MPVEKPPTLETLGGLGFITVEGGDSERFLQGQLSRDVPSLGSGDAPLAAWHSATGRVKAIFRVLRLRERWLLATEKELVTAVVNDLRRFVLRDDVLIREADDGWRAAALVGDSSQWLGQHEIDLGTRYGTRIDVNELLWVRIGRRLVYVIGPETAITELESEIPPGANGATAFCPCRVARLCAANCALNTRIWTPPGLQETVCHWQAVRLLAYIRPHGWARLCARASMGIRAS